MDPHSRDAQPSETFTRFLRQLEFFKHVDYSALRTILAASRQFTVKKGRAVFVEDEVARSGFVLVEGRLQLYSLATGLSSFVAAPAFLGANALIVETVRSATAFAETEVSLIEILRTTFLRVIAEYPESAAKLRSLIALRLQKTVKSLEAARAGYDALPGFSSGAREGQPSSSFRARKEG
jgi:CRP-like cAMP-binding protein